MMMIPVAVVAVSSVGVFLQALHQLTRLRDREIALTRCRRKKQHNHEIRLLYPLCLFLVSFPLFFVYDHDYQMFDWRLVIYPRLASLHFKTVDALLLPPSTTTGDKANNVTFTVLTSYLLEEDRIYMSMRRPQQQQHALVAEPTTSSPLPLVQSFSKMKRKVQNLWHFLVNNHDVIILGWQAEPLSFRRTLGPLFKFAILPYNLYREGDAVTLLAPQLATAFCPKHSSSLAAADTMCQFTRRRDRLCFETADAYPTQEEWWKMNIRIIPMRGGDAREPNVWYRPRYVLLAVNCDQKAPLPVQGSVHVESLRRRPCRNCEQQDDRNNHKEEKGEFLFAICMASCPGAAVVIILLLRDRLFEKRAERLAKRWKEEGHANATSAAARDEEWLLRRAKRQREYDEILTRQNKLTQRHCKEMRYAPAGDRTDTKWISRVTRELQDLQSSPIPGMVIGGSAFLDSRVVHFCLEGMDGTDTRGGIYYGKVFLPRDYPFKSPLHFQMVTPTGYQYFDDSDIRVRHYGKYRQWNPSKSHLRDYFVSHVNVWHRMTMMGTKGHRWFVVMSPQEDVEEFAEHSLECSIAVCPHFFDIFPKYIDQANDATWHPPVRL